MNVTHMEVNRPAVAVPRFVPLGGIMSCCTLAPRTYVPVCSSGNNNPESRGYEWDEDEDFDSFETIEAWINSHSKEDRLHLWTAAMMTWNYAASIANTGVTEDA